LFLFAVRSDYHFNFEYLLWMSILVKLIGEERLSNIYRRYAAKQIKEGLKAEFQDDNGRWYYSFRDEGDVPIDRTAMVQTHRQYLAAD
jgi:hypothetical protein